MEVLNVGLGIIIALAGFPIGNYLAKIAKEEIKQGKKYFIWMQRVTITLLIVFGILWNFTIFQNPVNFSFMCSLGFLYALPTAALVKL